MKSPAKSVTLAAMAVLSWSTVATAFKIALSAMNVYTMLLTASVTATVIFALLLTVTGKWGSLREIKAPTWRLLTLMGLINPTVYYVLLFTAYDLLPAQIAQPINYFWPILVMVMLAVCNRHPIPKGKYAGMGLSLAGVIIISAGGRGIEGSISPLGLTIDLSSACLWAVYWMLNNRIKGKADAAAVFFVTFMTGTVALLLFMPWGDFSIPSGAALGAGIYIGSFEMAVPFICFGVALNMTRNAALINQMCYLAPFLSLVFISTILHEPIMATTYGGLSLIIAGLVANQYVVKEKAEDA